MPLLVFALLAGTAMLPWLRGAAWSPSWYGIGVLALLSVKLLASAAHKPVTATAAQRAELAATATSVVVIPVYNEDPAMLGRCLRSLAEQTWKPSAIVVVDDGSKNKDRSPNLAALEEAERWHTAMRALGIDYTVHRFDKNAGKREALAFGFAMHPQAAYYVCVDSDTLLAPDALEEAHLPFRDEGTVGVTGLVLASNRRRNVLTALIDIRYASAFLAERAAYSKLGSVLCCCGSLSIYRGWVVRKYLDDFLGQTFLGQPAVFGDDRRLTNYALQEGRVVLQESAVAWTAVPERMGHYLRQQIRWNKSFWRESLWAIRHLPRNKPGMWLSLLELSSWITFTVMLLTALIVEPLRTGEAALWVYSVYVAVLAYARSVRYLETPPMPGDRYGRSERAAAFFIAPIYGVMHLVLLLPLRLWALCTLRSGTWGTRQSVEVTLDATT